MSDDELSTPNTQKRNRSVLSNTPPSDKQVTKTNNTSKYISDFCPLMVLLYSLNVNGLRNARKRHNVLIGLLNNKTYIAMVQETHCKSEVKAQEWIKEWKGKTFSLALW